MAGRSLAAWLDGFADRVNAQGYAPRMARGKVLLAARFSQWLEQEEIGVADVTPDHTDRYLRYRRQRLRPCNGDRHALRQFTDFLRQEGVLSFEDAPAGPMTDAERCVQAYELHLRQTRGLAPASIATYLPFVRNFLRHRFDSGPVTLSSVDADDVVGFARHMASGLRPKSAKPLVTALRSFLRYACHLGEAGPELVAAVPVVASWSMPQIPRGISPDQVSKLLAGIDRGSATGRRDHAILMLLARLGLRASETRFLELDDIDWTGGTLRLRAKGGRRKAFPLSEEVGEAIPTTFQSQRKSVLAARLTMEIRPFHLNPARAGSGRTSQLSCAGGLGLPQPSHSGAGSVLSSYSNDSFSVAAPLPREAPRSARSTPSRSGTLDARSAASFESWGPNSAETAASSASSGLPVLANVEAPHLAVLQPVLCVVALARTDRCRALLSQTFQIRHRVRMPRNLIPVVLCHDSRSLPNLTSLESARLTGERAAGESPAGRVQRI